MIEEDPCEDLDGYDKHIVWLCWGGAVLAIMGAFVSAIHSNYLWPFCIPVAYGLVWCARKLQATGRPSGDE